MLQIHTVDELSALQLGTSKRKLTHITETISEIVYNALLAESVLAKESIGIVKLLSTNSTKIRVVCKLNVVCLSSSFLVEPYDSFLNVNSATFEENSPVVFF